MSKQPVTDRAALRRLEDAVIDDIMNAPDDEIAALAAEEGLDLQGEAAAMVAMLEREIVKAGKAKMAAAKAAVAAYRPMQTNAGPANFGAGNASRRAANDLGAAVKLTMAARNERDQTERDLEGIQEDLAELEALRKIEEELS